ncbi:ATP-binding cassette domain-containing protein [Photorhabdus noenieputensis]|uniref:ATP-binding cassette domain-containing protein n=1 Tax=Photorhabdus noenieputensis TaxID=1208607 RepID=UPI001BD4D873|nr:AAA family ATPase [Photorhabdus noenieputensis]MBS9437756.1 ATP-binding cassette domain-containing protein [Photorhabdus noenieputensis]MCK3667910.1 AAA family ATPase [Photorhabdus noenieputensis]
MLEVVGLEVVINGKTIFSEVNCNFRVGLNRIAGVNGAGKTTFLSSIAGVNKVRKGMVNFIKNGEKHKFSLQRHGFYISDNVNFYNFITGMDVINLSKRYRKSNLKYQLDYYLNGFGISNYSGIEYGQMSLGIKKKFLLTSAFITDADVYIFDEPTNGLDSDSITFLIELLISLAEEKIVIFSSHDDSFLQELNVITYEIKGNKISCPSI